MAIYEPLPLPRLKRLPRGMAHEGTITIVLQEGVPIFRAARSVQERVQSLLDKAASEKISADESEELDRYQEIDDYLSHLNRLIRNSILARPS